MPDPPFEIGETYDRVDDVHERFGGNRYSGIAPCADHPYVFVFYGKSTRWQGYDDGLRDDGHLLYTGEGRDGTLQRGDRAIRDHAENGDQLHVFELEDRAWQVTYVGEYVYEGHHWTHLRDEDGEVHEAVRFELSPAVSSDVDADAPSLDDRSLDDLYAAATAAANGEEFTLRDGTSLDSFAPSELVREYALRAADGVCQGCGEPAPFRDENDEPFLEVHHLRRRTDGGADHPDNVVALCPNCHRRAHNAADADEFNERLIEEYG